MGKTQQAYAGEVSILVILIIIIIIVVVVVVQKKIIMVRSKANFFFLRVKMSIYKSFSVCLSLSLSSGFGVATPRVRCCPAEI
ncbi:MAG: hypothetical protein CRN43_20445 [Candidatus Nephrothrix sp. EaCA]|nr:MAG: hypothetical protein CRN43_20445 [Candidatus Nephrothrix sp. EaCA]